VSLGHRQCRFPITKGRRVGVTAHWYEGAVPLRRYRERNRSVRVYSAAGWQTGVIGSPAMIFRTKGTESFNEALTVALWLSPA
jgi:hypothetical protein